MLRYFCFLLFIAAVYTAPADDKVVSKHEHSETDVVVSLPDVIEGKVSKHSVTTVRPKIVEILESGNEHQTDGSYSFHYRGEDGTFREETAVLKNPGAKNQFLEVNGAYSFFDANGKEVVVHYKADDRGFVPEGNNIHDSISVAARQNSQLPALKMDNVDAVEDDDDDS